MLREAKGLSQPELARRIVKLGGPPKTTRSTVLKWENGDTKPENIGALAMLHLCDVLGLKDPRWIYYGPSLSEAADPGTQPPRR